MSGAVGLVWAAGANAQQTLSLRQAVEAAWARQPRVASAQQTAAAARAQADVAATTLWPVAGLSAQWDRGTDNANLGLGFPSPLPSISGTVPPADYSQRSAWTSAGGVYFSWEVLDFGRRRAGIQAAQRLAQAAALGVELRRLDVGAHAADAYLTVLAAQQQVRVAELDRQRWQRIAATIAALVQQQLRPGADASRAEAELAGARIRLAQAQRDLAAATAVLEESLAWTGPVPQLAALPAPPATPAAGTPLPHPQWREQQEAVAAAVLLQKEAARAALPRWYVLGAGYGRGTGVLGAGAFAGGATGLAPTGAGNWAVGLGADFSFTRWRAEKAQQRRAAANAAREQARAAAVEIALTAARRRAAADLAAAEQVVVDSPLERQAAATSEAQARVRYRSGLAGVVDLANAEQLLAQAERDDALSQLQLWRARLETAYAQGDLTAFLQATHGSH